MDCSVKNRKNRVTKYGEFGERSVFPHLIFVLILFFIPNCCLASKITWLPNLEWNTKENWLNNFIPKNGSHVVFPVEMRLSVGLPVQHVALDIAGLELPRDGAIALPQSGFLTISETSAALQRAQWLMEGPLLWVEPKNWNSERSKSAVPHLERIPCQNDIVVLPELKRMVSIQLPNTFGVKIQAVRVTGDTGDLPPWEWRTVSSQREFYGRPTSVGYTGQQSCLDCPCQPEKVGSEILKEVCGTPGAACLDLGCENPVKVEGHCCHYCGGRLVLPSETSLSLAKRVADLALKNHESTISWYARTTWDSKKEILVTGRDGYSMEKTLSAVDALTSALEVQGMKVLRIDTTGGEIHVSRWVAVMGPFFGSLLIAVFLLLVAFPYFGYSLPQVLREGWHGLRDVINNRNIDVTVAAPTLPRKPFRFAKFENAPEAEVELAVASSSANVIIQSQDTVTDEEEEDNGDDLRGEFANPLYSSGRRGAPEAPSFASLKKLQDDVSAEEEEIDLTVP